VKATKDRLLARPINEFVVKGKGEEIWAKNHDLEVRISAMVLCAVGFDTTVR
jgi:hypothetical protein